MAIFRGGKRIGPFDIRVGFPRDRSLDNVDGDPRLRRHANTENTIGKFRASMARAEGYARQARFAVHIYPPTSLGDLSGVMKTEGDDYEDQVTSPMHPTAHTMQALHKELGEQLNIHCDTISMPGHDLDTEALTTYGPPRNVVTGHNYGQKVNCSFYADKYLRERHFLELWQKMAVSDVSHRVGYYDTYTKGAKIHIFQLGGLDGINQDTPTYGIECTEVYPSTIDAVAYDYNRDSSIVKINCTFTYKQWFNLSTAYINAVEFGAKDQVLHKIKGRTGIAGILDSLPPELRRAGRDVYNQAKTQIPIGKLFGGKVFPPFT